MSRSWAALGRVVDVTRWPISAPQQPLGYISVPLIKIRAVVPAMVAVADDPAVNHVPKGEVDLFYPPARGVKRAASRASSASLTGRLRSLDRYPSHRAQRSSEVR